MFLSLDLGCLNRVGVESGWMDREDMVCFVVDVDDGGGVKRVY